MAKSYGQKVVSFKGTAADGAEYGIEAFTPIVTTSGECGPTSYHLRPSRERVNRIAAGQYEIQAADGRKIAVAAVALWNRAKASCDARDGPVCGMSNSTSGRFCRP